MKDSEGNQIVLSSRSGAAGSSIPRKLKMWNNVVPAERSYRMTLAFATNAASLNMRRILRG